MIGVDFNKGPDGVAIRTEIIFRGESKDVEDSGGGLESAGAIHLPQDGTGETSWRVLL